MSDFANNPDPIRAYLDAVRDYDEKAEKARELIKGIAAVCDALRYHLPEFLSGTYGLSIPREASGGFRAGPSLQFNMDEWPDKGALRSVIAEWHASFRRLNDAWDKVSEQDRGALRHPPRTLSST